MSGLDGLQPLPKGVQEIEMSVPPLKLRWDSVGFRFTCHPDGSETQIHVVWSHPIFPIDIEIPFQQIFYLERFVENVQTLIEKAKELQAPST